MYYRPSIAFMTSQISFDPTDGSMVFGETSTWSNAGLCTGNVLDGSTTSTYDPSVCHSELIYFPFTYVIRCTDETVIYFLG